MPYTPSVMPTRRTGTAITNNPTFQQYQAPDQGQTEQLAQGRVNQTLQEGGSLSPDIVAKLKARQKQSQLGMADQAKQQAQQALAQHGYQAAGGTRQGANAQIDMGTINNILNSNRDTDIQAATTNRQDILNAVQAATGFMNDRQNRSSDQYRNVLAGQGAQADSNFRIAGFNENQRQADNSGDLQSWVAQQQANQAADDSKLKNMSLLHGIDMDQMNFGENQRQFNDSLGFNYNQANQSQDNSLMDYLTRIFG
jgi:hypothetical protein